MIAHWVYISDSFSLDMLPYPLPATLSFREISLEEAKEILQGKYETTHSLVGSPNKAHIISRRLGCNVPPSRRTSEHLRSYVSLIVAEVSVPNDKRKIWELLDNDAIDHLPIKFTIVEIVEISARSF